MRYVTLFAAAVLFVFIAGCVQPPPYVPPTISVVHPSDIITNVNSIFTVTISCEPSQPIMGWEMEIQYDASMLQVQGLREGNYATISGHSSFFTPNSVIDNTNGTITKVYGVILGHGNMTFKPCSLVIITFRAIAQGTTMVHIEKLGIANATGYIQSTASDGKITIR